MHTIAIVSGQGGVGKSTIAANLAVALTQRGQKTLVIDFDPQNSQKFHLGLDADQYAGLSREGLGPHAIFESPFGTPPAQTDATAEQDAAQVGLYFVPFGRLSLHELNEFKADLASNPVWLSHSIAALESLGFDCVIIDTPTGPGVFLDQALNSSQLALHVLLPDAASYQNRHRFAALIHAANANLQLESANNESDANAESIHESAGIDCRVLINQMPVNNALAHQVRDAIFADEDLKTVPLVIHQDASVAQALGHETPLLEFRPHTMASLDYQYLADWVVDFLEVSKR